MKLACQTFFMLLLLLLLSIVSSWRSFFLWLLNEALTLRYNSSAVFRFWSLSFHTQKQRLHAALRIAILGTGYVSRGCFVTTNVRISEFPTIFPRLGFQPTTTGTSTSSRQLGRPLLRSSRMFTSPTKCLWRRTRRSTTG